MLLGVYFAIYPLCLSAQTDTSSDVEPDACPQRQIYSSLELIDYYQIKTRRDPQGFLYSYSFKAGWDQRHGFGRLAFEYRQQNLIGEISNLHNEDDRIDFDMPDSGLRIDCKIRKNNITYNPLLILGNDFGGGFACELESSGASWQGALSAKNHHAYLNYKVLSHSGEIPFHWVLAKAAAGYRRNTLVASLWAEKTLPYASDSLYSNRVFISRIGLTGEYGWNQSWIASASTAFTNAGAELRYRGEQYGKLDILRCLEFYSKVEKRTERLHYGFGVDAWLSGIGDDSYFDIWPFTAWDIFLAHRTRIKSFTIQAASPHLGALYSSKRETENGFGFSAGLSYHHLFHSEDILIRNRIVVMYPFFFTYENYRYDFHDDVNGYFKLPLRLGYRFSKTKISLEAQQLAPIKWSNIFKTDIIDPVPDPDSGRRQWGGSSIKLSFSAGW